MSPCPLRLFVTENMMSMLSLWCWASPCSPPTGHLGKTGKENDGITNPRGRIRCYWRSWHCTQKNPGLYFMFYALSNDLAGEMSPGVSGWALVWVGEHGCEWVSMGVNRWAWVWMDEPGCEWVSLGVSPAVSGWIQMWTCELRYGWVSTGVSWWAQGWVGKPECEWAQCEIQFKSCSLSQTERQREEEEWRGEVEAELVLNLSVSCSLDMNMLLNIRKKKNHHWDLSGPTGYKLVVLLPSGFS